MIKCETCENKIDMSEGELYCTEECYGLGRIFDWCNDNEEYQTQKKTIKGEVYFFLKNGYIETFYKEYTEEQKSYVNLYRTEIEVNWVNR